MQVHGSGSVGCLTLASRGDWGIGHMAVYVSFGQLPQRGAGFCARLSTVLRPPSINGLVISTGEANTLSVSVGEGLEAVERLCRTLDRRAFASLGSPRAPYSSRSGLFARRTIILQITPYDDCSHHGVMV
jgi:hypothetical protein